MTIIKSSRPFNQFESIALDIIRFTLAMIVLVGHMSQRQFESSARMDLTLLAIFAVGGFFILSGYTIKAITPQPDDFIFRDYIAARFAKILSVSIPALALTIAADFASYSLDSEYYVKYWGDNLKYPALRILGNLFLWAEPYGKSFSPLSNSPFWSLSYETGFYVLFGLWTASVKESKLRWALALAAILYGPHILIMMSFWMIGVLLYYVARSHRRLILGASIVCISLVAITFEHLAERSGSVRPSSYLINAIHGLRMREAHMTNALILGVVLSAALLTPILCVARSCCAKWSFGNRFQHIARTLGELTFPLYLMHFPLLVLFKASGLWKSHSLPCDLFVGATIVILSYAAVSPTNKLKDVMRKAFGSKRHVAFAG